ncbi:DsrE/DsrF/TusD sulfur relay family protein [Aggregatilinea lenta]|uniref:DsrE/DsrF/TusD sulfur relay family protein n=1 Tax=Aggregatilinea lenta TaxID=913108 RepID=UPI001EE7A7E3|nr:DsrE family protein [Aggregatilinea lenta]
MDSPTAQNILIIINDGPYGNERAYNALRLGMNLAKRAEATVRVFLVGDGVACAKRNQTTPQGYYNVERMLKPILQRGQVAV